jgi:cellulose synthase/poly-beta-1,6-N-acetylglucosamine synthase-like glycosyltransferase/peptidoglycan/xylan/chitin deacetylase (PgdA/CDA1 family)/spore germination protein YaaH
VSQSGTGPSDSLPEASGASARPAADDAVPAGSLVGAYPSVPVFYDEDRRRAYWFVRVLLFILIVATIGICLLATSLIALPLMPQSLLPKASVASDVGNRDPALTNRERQLVVRAFHEDRKKLSGLLDKDVKRREQRLKQAQQFLREWQTNAAAPVPKNPPNVVAGFYVNWEETSRASTRRNIDALTHFIPDWLSIKPAGTDFADLSLNPLVDIREAYDRTRLTESIRSHHVPIVPLLNNYTKPAGTEETEGKWDTEAVHEIVSNPVARVNLVEHIRDWLLRERMQGINIDFEEVADGDRADLVLFMKELYEALHPHHLLVTEDVQLEQDGYDLAALAKWSDWLVPMFYDEHAGGTEPGPVAGIDWTRRDLAVLLTKVPPEKIVMGVGNHGYDWRVGSKVAQDVTYESAIMTARDSQPDAKISLDPAGLNPTYHYSETVTEPDGKSKEVEHVVWMQDATTVFNQLTIGRRRHVRGAALWFLGAEDPTLFRFFNRQDWDADWSAGVRSGDLDAIDYKGQGEIDFEGEGELLQPIAAPEQGRRTLSLNTKTGLIDSEQYSKDPKTGDTLFPTSWVVRRYGGTQGNVNKQLVLTFDDGPDPTFTPQVLDILEKYHVPAVFFVIGKNAEDYPDLVQREWSDGFEIGDHTWSHPNLARVSDERQKLEVTTTQRVIQAITGHSTRLFRPPYGVDTEPSTGEEVVPMERAAALHYITVGEKNDPQDWRLFEYRPGRDDAVDPSRPRSAEEIVKSVVVNRDVGSVVLLHDGGGDRRITIQALPEIITQLRAMGYHFVNLAELTKIPPATLMPRVTSRDILLSDADRYVFEVTYITQRTLTTLFALSIILGVSRIGFLLVLALIQRAKERGRTYPSAYRPSVSVVVAAFNEERVIVRTVQALLESEYPDLEIIVVDDGSKDNTYSVVTGAFHGEPKVTVFTKPNGGKASALNRGISSAKGEVIVSLDADTLFAPNTIANLVRHFADPKVGAVSGNVQVGNANNLLTWWQALEYTTSQNFDRRAYDLLNCITVVPGAVGALRRSAVVAVGGYTSDTLAEDTDLTWKLRRAGWRIVNDNSAMAFTEAPERLSNLAKQRYRWAFGTLQCLWKHRAALFQHGTFGWIALPSLWQYQIAFPAISPFMDICMVYAAFAGNFGELSKYYVLMFGIELVAATIATAMGKGNPRLLPWLFFQRFVYRQLMYYVVLKAIVAAIRGGAVGWNKFERTGTAKIEGQTA